MRDDRQLALVCKALLERVRLGDLWAADGPTATAVGILERGGGPMSSGEVLMLRLAFDLWNGEGHLELGRALQVLDGGNLRALGSLLLVLAEGDNDAIDVWLLAQENDRAHLHCGVCAEKLVHMCRLPALLWWHMAEYLDCASIPGSKPGDVEPRQLVDVFVCGECLVRSPEWAQGRIPPIPVRTITFVSGEALS